MRQFFLTFTVLFACLISHAQMHADSALDSLIKKAIIFSIESPQCIDCDSTGISLIQVYVDNDSLKIKSLYSSGNGYNFDSDKQIIKKLNTELINQVPKGYNAAVPIYFYYYNGRPNAPSDKAQKYVQQKITKLKNKMIVMKPIVYTSFPTVH